MIQIVAMITAKPGKRQAILDELIPRVPEVHAEEGCIEYTVTIDEEIKNDVHEPQTVGPDTFVIVEKWESLEHLKAHTVAPFVQEYMKIAGPLMAGRVMHFLKPVS